MSVDRDALAISGERRFHDEREGDDFRRIEHSFGRFHRVVRLPAGSDPDGVAATHRDGMLEVHIPKTQDPGHAGSPSTGSIAVNRVA